MKGFLYHAHAVGVSGHLNSPFKDVIEVQAPSALPVTGGYSRGRVDNFRYKEIISFKAAYTQTTGEFSPETDSWDTQMTATIEGLNIMGMVTADLIVARLTSRHKTAGGQPSILPLGSRFEGLRIAGHPVDVRLNTGKYCEYDTHEGVKNAYKTNKEFREEFDELHQVGKHDALPETHHSYFPWSKRKANGEIPNANGMIALSLVKKLEYDTDCFKHHGHVIYLPHFGKVILGQLLISPDARRITMLQVDLGCSVCGSVAAGGGETNGSKMPPGPIGG